MTQDKKTKRIIFGWLCFIFWLRAVVIVIGADRLQTELMTILFIIVVVWCKYSYED